VAEEAMNPGDSWEVSFTAAEEMLRSYDLSMRCVSAPGESGIFIGPGSHPINSARFTQEQCSRQKNDLLPSP
jgi:hypothetical protein